jgi:hypothetical protein
MFYIRRDYDTALKRFLASDGFTLNRGVFPEVGVATAKRL